MIWFSALVWRTGVVRRLDDGHGALENHHIKKNKKSKGLLVCKQNGFSPRCLF